MIVLSLLPRLPYSSPHLSVSHYSKDMNNRAAGTKTVESNNGESDINKMELWGEIVYNINLLIFLSINNLILSLQPEGEEPVCGDKGHTNRGQGGKDK